MTRVTTMRCNMIRLRAKTRRNIAKYMWQILSEYSAGGEIRMSEAALQIKIIGAIRGFVYATVGYWYKKGVK